MFKGLPEHGMCYYDATQINGSKRLVVILKVGESGYYPVDVHPSNVHKLNKSLGVTNQQREAMMSGSMHLWTSPMANPENYNDAGEFVKPMRRSNRERNKCNIDENKGD